MRKRTQKEFYRMYAIFYPPKMTHNLVLKMENYLETLINHQFIAIEGRAFFQHRAWVEITKNTHDSVQIDITFTRQISLIDSVWNVMFYPFVKLGMIRRVDEYELASLISMVCGFLLPRDENNSSTLSIQSKKPAPTPSPTADDVAQKMKMAYSRAEALGVSYDKKTFETEFDISHQIPELSDADKYLPKVFGILHFYELDPQYIKVVFNYLTRDERDILLREMHRENSQYTDYVIQTICPPNEHAEIYKRIASQGALKATDVMLCEEKACVISKRLRKVGYPEVE